MEETVVIKGLTRQAKMADLPLPYFMTVVGLTVLPFMVTKALLWLPTFAIWYFGARSITAINPNGHRLIAMRLCHLPQSFGRTRVRFQRSTKGRASDV